MNEDAIPLLENKMVEIVYRVRKEVTEYAESTIFIRNRTINHPVCGQDIAVTKMERIIVSHEYTQQRERNLRRYEQNLWR